MGNCGVFPIWSHPALLMVGLSVALAERRNRKIRAVFARCMQVSHDALTAELVDFNSSLVSVEPDSVPWSLAQPVYIFR